jgi:cytochrome c biogenesis protein
MGVVGMTIRQLPSFALLSVSDYQNQMARLHAIYDPLLGASVVDLLDRLQVFRIFSSTYFTLALLTLIASIVVCTLDRTPRLWRQVRDVRVVQPDPYYDPSLPDRAAMNDVPADALHGVLRRHRFRVRETVVDGTRYLYGDRHQYTKLATLVSHAGLILFLLAAAITTALGHETGLVVADGDSLTVQPVGTPNLLLVKNLGFSAPGLATGQVQDYTTDLAVYQNGRQIAEKVIRVNDPLSIAGYTFHQNGFGPAPVVLIRDVAGRTLWSGSVPLTDVVNNVPTGSLTVPGTNVALQLALTRLSSGETVVVAQPSQLVGTNPDGTPVLRDGDPFAITVGGTTGLSDLGFAVTLESVSQYTLLIAKNDPGQGLVWLAFTMLIVGLSITFYLPRRRVWARIGQDGRLAIVGRSDRYVDFEREFGALLDDLVAVRRPAAPARLASTT